ncbi:RNA-directed DNA polymerase, eukaryota [Tanacetum coccineum]
MYRQKTAYFSCSANRERILHLEYIPNGCNPSFIALIPKVLDAKHLNDFRPISLIGCQYKIIGKILANRLSLVIDDIISHEQSAFIKGRQILDRPLILNEIVSWCKARNEKTLMFKVDFQKVFDSVRWDHLDDILGRFGFGSKWRGWIRGCLQSSKASVLINGSPTDEFLFHRGLRQGDPLSPFLFILVMESLHVAFQRVIERGISNVSTLVMMLHCFFRASGLKIKVNKSSLYDVGVHSSDVQHLANSFGCMASNLPFAYLGVKVGANMTHINSWQEVIQKVTSKLSKWKAKALSVGGRPTLIKSVLGSLPTYYMSMFKVPDGVLNHLDGCSVWLMVRNAITNLKSKGVDLMEFCKKVIGNGGAKECQWQKFTQLLSSIVLSSANDCWSWTLNGNGIFSMKSAREVIDKHLLIISSTSMRWYVVPTGRVVVPTGRYVVPTGRVVVPTGRYVVPAGKVIIIVSPGRLSLVPTGRILSPGSDNDSDDASVHSEATIPQQQRNNQPQYITTVSNNNAKFPYLKKDE